MNKETLAQKPCCLNMAAGTSCLADPRPNCPLLAAAPQPAQQQEPVALGYMNAGQVYEMQHGKLPYGYVYLSEGPGARVAIYTSPPAQQEPMAWPAGLIERITAAEQRIQDGHAPRRIPADPTDVDLVLAEVRYLLEGKQPPFWVSTSPPAQRTWVGLTEEEINIAASVQSWKPFARAIEAKLKEKNT